MTISPIVFREKSRPGNTHASAQSCFVSFPPRNSRIVRMGDIHLTVRLKTLIARYVKNIHTYRTALSYDGGRTLKLLKYD